MDQKSNNSIDPNAIKIPKAPSSEAPASEHPSPATPDSQTSATPDSPDESSPPPTPDDAPPFTVNTLLSSKSSGLHIGELVVDQNEKAYVVIHGKGNPRTFKVGSNTLNVLVAQHLTREGTPATKFKVAEVVERLSAEASLSGRRVNVWRRVAQLDDGHVVVALNDDKNTQVWIGPNRVDIVTEGSEVLFYVPKGSAPMTMPAQVGDVKLLRKYLNITPEQFVLYLAWLTYTLAHAKKPGNVFLILLLLGGQGTGKSWLSKLTMRFIDPNVIGVERIPRRVQDLAVATQNAHLIAYDNLRYLSHDMSDALCTVATGGSLSSRRLYTDDEQNVLTLHAAMLLNGIHPFADQPDLAQRCLPLRLEPINETDRKPEDVMLKAFEQDLPIIQRGLFDMIASVLAAMPKAVVTDPQRMYSFVRWLAAMEVVDAIPQAGIYQGLFSELINEGQLDSLQENVLGSAVLDFAMSLEDGTWTGTPANLLGELNSQQPSNVLRHSRDWPINAIAMSKRLAGLEAALMTQGIKLISKRGKERSITVERVHPLEQ